MREPIRLLTVLAVLTRRALLTWWPRWSFYYLWFLQEQPACGIASDGHYRGILRISRGQSDVGHSFQESVRRDKGTGNRTFATPSVMA